MKTIVLLGMGYSNLHFVWRWASSPRGDCKLVCISDRAATTYSGMMSGVLARQFDRSQAEIDLANLVRQSGAEFVVGNVEKFDLGSRTIHLAGNSTIEFDVLSIGVGSKTSNVGANESCVAVPLKPLHDFIRRLDNRIIELQVPKRGQRFRISVVGGMAALEILLCLPMHLQAIHPDIAFDLELVCEGNDLCQGLSLASHMKLERLLRQRSVLVRKRVKVTSVNASGFTSVTGEEFSSDCVLWATGGKPPDVIAQVGIPLDHFGFVSTHSTLKSVADYPVFASGDSGSILDAKIQKSGVVAVRQGPVLWENVHRFLDGRDLVEFRPKPYSLKLINTGEGRALMDYRGFSSHSRLWWWLKKRIDFRFVRRYQPNERN